MTSDFATIVKDLRVDRADGPRRARNAKLITLLAHRLITKQPVRPLTFWQRAWRFLASLFKRHGR